MVSVRWLTIVTDVSVRPRDGFADKMWNNSSSDGTGTCDESFGHADKTNPVAR